jgi:hypothetical protein
MAAGDTLPAGIATSVSAVQRVSLPANAVEGIHHAGAHIVAIKNSKRPAVLRDERSIPDPPASSDPIAAPTASKRLPKDWDERISTDTPRLTRAADLPAGRIDSRDFR